jgi:hypothetical protein
VTKVPISCTETGKWSCEELEASFANRFQRFPLLENQVGILAFLGRHLLGLDVIGSPDLYSPVHRRLLTGYFITALAAGGGKGLEPEAQEIDVHSLAQALEGAERVAAPCPGYGEYNTLRGTVSGGELRHNGQLVHLSVFPNGFAA